jgi:hypothetical protein
MSATPKSILATCWRCGEANIAKAATCQCGAELADIDVLRKNGRVVVRSTAPVTEFEKAEARFWTAVELCRREIDETRLDFGAIERQHEELRKMLDHAEAHIAKHQAAHARGERWVVERR